MAGRITVMTNTWRVPFRGRTTCACVAEWIPAWEAACRASGITSGFTRDGTVIIFQLTGTAAASAGTHSQGGAIDTAMLDPRGILLAREMGASASWRRLWAGNLHSHLVLDGCPHNGPARYQIAAVKAGRDGLGFLGMKGRDTEPRPARWRTWREGLAWARAQQALEIIDMATPAEIKQALTEVLIDGEARKTPTGRQLGDALSGIVAHGVKRALAEIGTRKTPADRQAHDTLRKAAR